MRFADQHIHSACSPDSDTPMRMMAKAAQKRGMSAVCFTDHIDMDDPFTGAVRPDYPVVWPNRVETARALVENPPEGIEIRFGVELGEATHYPELAAEVARQPELDFVLGSLHNLKNERDFYSYPYKSEEECSILNRRYMKELLQLADFPGFDVMAHIGYTSRYMHRDGFRSSITIPEYRDVYAELFTRLIAQGRGIEVNCKSIPDGYGTYVSEDALRLYKDLGGEIVTVGSDGHNVATASLCVKDGYALLEKTGFCYVAEYIKRKPVFYKIG